MVPRELEEAAEVDGAGKIQIFFRVVTPISLPAYASVAIIIFTQVWNEFLLALTLSTPLATTIQVKLAEVKGSFVALYNPQDGGWVNFYADSLDFLLAPRALFYPRHSGWSP